MRAPNLWYAASEFVPTHRRLSVFLPGKKKEGATLLPGCGAFGEIRIVETIAIYLLPTLPSSLRRRLYAAQHEAACVWTLCRDRHLAARQQHTRWPDRDDLQRATKGGFALHSQTVQMICHQFLANVEATRERRLTNRRIRYPYKDKRFFPLYWPAQAVSVERGRIVLPMGRGRPSLVFKLDPSEPIGSVKLVWKDGYELHVSVPVTSMETGPGPVQAAVDLGEIHQAAVTTNTGVALVVSGRGIRALKRRHHMALGSWPANANAAHGARGGGASCNRHDAR